MPSNNPTETPSNNPSLMPTTLSPTVSPSAVSTRRPIESAHDSFCDDHDTAAVAIGFDYTISNANGNINNTELIISNITNGIIENGKIDCSITKEIILMILCIHRMFDLTQMYIFLILTPTNERNLINF